MRKNNLLRTTAIIIFVFAILGIIIIPFSWMAATAGALMHSLFGGIFRGIFGVFLGIFAMFLNLFRLYAGFQGFRHSGNQLKADQLTKFGIIMVAIDVINIIIAIKVFVAIRLVISLLYLWGANQLKNNKF